MAKPLIVLKLGRVTLDRTLDEHGNNKHIDRLVALQHWASAAEAPCTVTVARPPQLAAAQGQEELNVKPDKAAN